MTGPTEILDALPPHVDARMTRRARGYLWITSAPAAGNAAFCFFGGATFRSPTAGASYVYAGRTFPFAVWGLFFLTVAILAAVSAATGNERIARVALIGSGALLCGWAMFFAVAAAAGVAGPTGVIMWGTLGVKDVIMCRNPLRTPFEKVTDTLAPRL